eukprot:Lithocolla_globosa_v1_NODE_799_length_3265_cov_5.501246.p1 type:complete len:262 gc:universal NODE_799_length_3265_cov_5.501246:653-1438(+)
MAVVTKFSFTVDCFEDLYATPTPVLTDSQFKTHRTYVFKFKLLCNEYLNLRAKGNGLLLCRFLGSEWRGFLLSFVPELSDSSTNVKNKRIIKNMKEFIEDCREVNILRGELLNKCPRRPAILTVKFDTLSDMTEALKKAVKLTHKVAPPSSVTLDLNAALNELDLASGVSTSSLSQNELAELSHDGADTSMYSTDSAIKTLPNKVIIQKIEQLKSLNPEKLSLLATQLNITVEDLVKWNYGYVKSLSSNNYTLFISALDSV